MNEILEVEEIVSTKRTGRRKLLHRRRQHLRRTHAEEGLLCIGRFDYRELGPERDTCTFKAYPISGATSGSLRSEDP
jgi:hypothetical protein